MTWVNLSQKFWLESFFDSTQLSELTHRHDLNRRPHFRKLWKAAASSSSAEKNRNLSTKMATFAKRLAADASKEEDTNRGRLANKILQQQQTKQLWWRQIRFSLLPRGLETYVQGDRARWFKPPIDMRTKVPFWPGLPWPGQAKTELLFWCQREVWINEMCYPVLYAHGKGSKNTECGFSPGEGHLSAAAEAIAPQWELMCSLSRETSLKWRPHFGYWHLYSACRFE